MSAELWLWEDCFLEGGLTAATAALAWTERLQVGVGLLPVPLRNPAVAAMEIATLARLFPGRFLPGLGHGVLDWMAQVGAAVPSPMTLLREYTAAVRDLLHGRTVDVDGRFVHLDGVALDWPPPEVPPLLVGARGPKTVRLAGEVADGVILDSGLTRDGGPGGVRAVAEGRAAAGRTGAVPHRRLRGAGRDGGRPAGAGRGHRGRARRRRRRHRGVPGAGRGPRPGAADRGLRGRGSALPVDLPPVTDGDDEHHELAIVDPVDDAVVAGAYAPPPSAAHQLHCGRRPRLRGEQFDGGLDPAPSLRIELPELADCAFGEA